MALVEFRGVTKVFEATSRKDRAVEVLHNIDLDIEEGEIFGLIGQSGAGKSTLVRLINGLTPATNGSIKVIGDEVTTMPEPQLRKLRQNIGMIFQQFNLMNSKTIWANVAYPLQIAKIDKDEQARRVSNLLHFVGLADKAYAFPDQLSGGQKQRVGIARALANHPQLLLADEATSALDPDTTREVLDLLRRVNQEMGTTIVLITHEMEVIRQIAHRVAVLEDGKIVEQGDVYHVFTRQEQPVTRRFVSTVLELEPTPDTLVELRERHPDELLLSFTFDDDQMSQEKVFKLISDAGVRFQIVHGGVNDIRGRTFGSFVLALSGPPSGLDLVLSQLRSHDVPVKELA
jgi:D-methionine transport system ATP-binding protein